MDLTALPITELIRRLGYGDDFLRTDVCDELIRRAKRGEIIDDAVAALTHAAEHDDVLGVKNLAKLAIAEAEKSARGENKLSSRLTELITAKNWDGLVQLMRDRHIGYEVTCILRGDPDSKRAGTELNEISRFLVRTLEINRIDLSTLPRELSSAIRTAQTRQFGNPMTGPTGSGIGRRLTC
ncbi:MAG: hypothetical protein ABID61_02310 [Candidatus Micrarchaeota archaeon]